MGGLTAKQLRFVEEYLVDLNAAAAARRAGYSERTARNIGQENLTKPDIAAAIAEAQQRRSERTEITSDRVLAEWGRLALYDPADIAQQPMSGPRDIARLPENVRRAIVGWGWDSQGNFTLKLANKQAALDSIAKHLGMMTERTINVDISGLSTEELERIANGEDPLSVLADTRAGGTREA